MRFQAKILKYGSLLLVWLPWTCAWADGVGFADLLFTEYSSTNLTTTFEGTLSSVTFVSPDYCTWTPPELIGTSTATAVLWIAPGDSTRGNFVYLSGNDFTIISDILISTGSPDGAFSSVLQLQNNTPVSGVLTVYSGSTPVEVMFNDLAMLLNPHLSSFSALALA